MTNWAVFEWETGTLWGINPDTEENAIKEAELAGLGHSPVTVPEGIKLSNAFNHGRMHAIEQIRKAESRNER